MEIYGLLDLERLEISDKKEVNFENYRIFSYRVSELGADGIVVKGVLTNEDNEFLNVLKNEVDIPIFKLEELENVITTKEFLQGKKGNVLLLEDSFLLEYFDGRKEFIPIFIALMVYKAKKEGFSMVIVSDVEAAKASLKIE